MTTLIALIEAHGHHAIEQDGELMGLSHFSMNRDGRSYFEWERIECTRRAVLRWLGY